MKALLIDAGNTRLKAAWLDGETLTPLPPRPVDDKPSAQMELPGEPQRIIVGSSSPAAVREKIDRALRRRFDLEPEWLRARPHFHGLINNYDEPQKLGVDRWLALLAVDDTHYENRQSCIVDCGTAITVDLLAEEHYLGGFILPGARLMEDSLIGGVESLSQAAGTADDTLRPATNTADAIHRGALRAAVHAIDGLLDWLTAEYGAMNPILTGGDAPRLLPHLRHRFIHRPLLVLEGLAAYAHKTVANPSGSH